MESMTCESSSDMKADPRQLEQNTSTYAGSLQNGINLDSLGLEAPTKRDIGLIGIVALGWNICNSWAAIAATMIFSIVSGGPVTLIYGTLLIFILGGSCAATMAELASVYPTAGGQYHWTGWLAPQKWSRAMGYICGMINLLGWVATAAGFIITVSQLITGIAMFLNPSYTAETWHVFLIFQLANFVFVLYNILLIKRTGWIHQVGFFISLVGFLVILITCLARNPPKQPSSFVWSTFINDSGWSSDGIVFLAGLVNPNFIYSGLDGAIHLAEECTNPERIISLALMSTVIVGFVTSFAFGIAMTYCTTDIDSVLSAPIPILEIWSQATSSDAAAVTFTIVLLTCACFACVGCHQTASRLTYSFARDKALVLSPILAKVSPRFGVPIWALTANGIVVGLIGFVYLGSSTAFNSMVSTGLILQQISFAIPAGLIMWRKRSTKYLLPERYFRMGPLGWIANALTIVLAVMSLVFYSFPAQLPATSSNMNYVCVILGVMAIFGAINWFGYATRHYHGPSDTH